MTRTKLITLLAGAAFAGQRPALPRLAPLASGCDARESSPY